MLAPITSTLTFVKSTLKNAEAGHDWLHTERVWKLAKQIAEEEEANTLVVELAALLHDIADSKFHDGNEDIGAITAQQFLKTQEIDHTTIEQVVYIVKNMSFHHSIDGESVKNIPLEMKIVQDADRLDAIGAIGIARTFHYGGFRNRLLYHPEIPPQQFQTTEAYKKSESPTINHFFEKLLLLKDTFHTETAKQMAEKRHQLMESFVQQFFEEINLKIFQPIHT